MNRNAMGMILCVWMGMFLLCSGAQEQAAGTRVGNAGVGLEMEQWTGNNTKKRKKNTQDKKNNKSNTERKEQTIQTRTKCFSSSSSMNEMDGMQCSDCSRLPSQAWVSRSVQGSGNRNIPWSTEGRKRTGKHKREGWR